MVLDSSPQFLISADPSVRDLFRRRITDLNTLRSRCRDSICLALDVEGSDGQGGGITSIGLALVWDFLEGRQRTNISTDLAKMVQEYGIKGYNMVCGVRKRNHGQYERSPFAKVEEVHKGDVDIYLNKILDSAKSVADLGKIRRDIGPSFIMIVWNGYGEFQAIASAFPSIAKNISHIPLGGPLPHCR
jgi:hypothetical protein